MNEPDQIGGLTNAEWQARTGLSKRDVAAFVEAWKRSGEKVPLHTFLGWIPQQPSVIDLNRAERAHAS